MAKKDKPPKDGGGGGGGGGGKPPKDGGGAGGKKKPPKESSPGLSVPDPSRETLSDGGRRRDTDDATSKKKPRFQGEGAIRVGLNVPQPSRNGLNFPPVD